MPSEMREAIDDALRRILAKECAPATVRAIENNGSGEALWATIEESGFLDALVPGDLGGVGLRLTDVLPAIFLSGEFAVPVPLAETIVTRAVLARLGIACPTGPVTIAGGVRLGDGRISSMCIFHAATSQHVLVDLGSNAILLPLSGTGAPTGAHSGQGIEWDAETVATASVAPSDMLGPVRAFLYAGLLAGALTATVRISLDYANERNQFGRAIGKFQAIQHQLARAAEHVFAARMAVELAAGDDALPDRLASAVAKARASEAAATVPAIAHAVHGAIGFTEEFDLQIYSRRIAAWRMEAGAEQYWHRFVGKALIEGKQAMTLDFVRAIGAVT